MSSTSRPAGATGSAFPIEVGEARTTGILYGGDGARATIVLAHGAGAPQTHPWMVAMARALSDRAFAVVTFNFLYTEARRRVPDRNDLLEATWRAAIDAVRARGHVGAGRLFVGGKSMGGRIASQVAARADARAGIAGVVLLGYPLHPPGNPEKRRVAHLPDVRVPMLFVQGERDTFGTRAELEPVVEGLRAQVQATRLFVIEGGDHSLATRRKASPPAGDVFGLVADEIGRFVASTG